jgi:hypothetical protein
MLDFIVNNKELAISILGVILTIFGWVTVFLLNLGQQKKLLKDTARIKIYEELYLLKNKIDKDGIELGVLLGKYSLPFLDMTFKMTTDPVNGNLLAINLWNEHLKKLGDKIYNFSQSYLKLLTHSEMWSGVMPQIKIAKEELFAKQLTDLSKKLNEYLGYLRDQQLKQYNPMLWDRSNIETKADKILDLFDEIGVGYIDDYLGLIHNRLASPVLGHKKIPRENFVNLDKLDKYYILTEQGLKEIVNKNPINKK